jgi:hypothetical protein
MQLKTIKKIITAKMEEWLSTIEDKALQAKVRKNIVVSGGCITALLQKVPVNDFDVYIQDMDVLVALAKYYFGGTNGGDNQVWDGRKKDMLVKNFCESKRNYREAEHKGVVEGFAWDQSEAAVRLKTLQPDQVKLNIQSAGIRYDQAETNKENKKYQVAFLSQNAISLTDDVQIVLRFSGTVENIHKTFDFIHATNYFTFAEGVVLNMEALQSIITKSLVYQGSLYPLTSIIRMKKFILRGWTINAGEILKIMFQISELDLRNIEVLEQQLIGVDIAYFAKLIEVLRNSGKEDFTSAYLSSLIDKVFNEDVEETASSTDYTEYDEAGESDTRRLSIPNNNLGTPAVDEE